MQQTTACYILGRQDAQNYRTPTHQPYWTPKQKSEYERGYASV